MGIHSPCRPGIPLSPIPLAVPLAERWSLMVRGRLLRLVLVVIIGSFALFALALVIVAAWSCQVSAYMPKTVSGIVTVDPTFEAWALSPAQRETLGKWGYPDSFAILFFDEQSDAGTVEATRYETWSYYTRGHDVTFINGDLASENPLQPATNLVTPMPYKPERFAAYMTLPQVVNAGRLASFTEIPLESKLVPGGKSYFADRLTFGIKDGKLRYIETLPLVD